MRISKRILYSNHRGGVSVCLPSQDLFDIMNRGGHWDDQPRGFLQEQIERQIGSGIAPDHAKRFAHAVAFGGVTEAEAWGIIKDRDCARFGVAHELIDASELPSRWFRDAWRRSSNGGPIWIDLEKARPIHWGRIRKLTKDENARREESFEPVPLIDVPWETIRGAIRHARDEDELARIWPEGLPPWPSSKAAPANRQSSL